MRKTILAGAMAAALTAGMVGVASAGPLGPPGLDLNVACADLLCAGEGAAPNGQIPPFTNNAVQHVDWIAFFDGNANGGWTYLYQVENSSQARLSTLNITSGFFQAVGHVVGGIDLDSTNVLLLPVIAGGGSPAIAPIGPYIGHTGPLGPHANLGTPDGTQPCSVGFASGSDDCEVADLGAPVDATSTFLIGGSLTIVFGDGGLAVGRESGLIVAQGIAPVYVPWNTSSPDNPSVTWNSTNCNPTNAPNTPPCAIQVGEQGRPIAGPGPQQVPEPASLLLLASGLLGFGFWSRRRRQS